MTLYLPWWIAGAALSFVTLGFYIALHRPLGVSGSWARIILWKNDRAIKQAEAPFQDNPKLFEDALMAATIEEFGEEKVLEYMQSRHKTTDTQAVKPTAQSISAIRSPWTAHLLFLVMLIVGGVVGAYLRGELSIQPTLGELHTSLFGSGIGSLMMLFFGGLMVGFGTQMAGGCTSGHGLSGLSRLAPASIIATITFFGTAIAFSMAAHYLG